MSPAEFNPYETPRAEIAAKPKAARRAVTVTLVQLVAVAWVFAMLVWLLFQSRHLEKPRTGLERTWESAGSALTMLSLTIASAMTVVCLVGLVLRAIFRQWDRLGRRE